MKSLMAYADPFWGTDEVQLPPPEGVAAAWHPIKAMIGATDPGAAIPFGKLTCSPYTGGFSSGYSRCAATCGGPVPYLDDKPRFRGVTHLHHSGTGYVANRFYNYLRTVAFEGADAPQERDFVSETAHPGYYACTLSDGIGCELTVGPAGAVHRYAFPGGRGRVAVEVSHGGLDRRMGDSVITRPTQATMRVAAPDLAVVSVTMQGISLVAVIHCPGAAECRLFSEAVPVEQTELALAEKADHFGLWFEVPEKTCEVKITLTARDEAAALADLAELPDFETVKAAAQQRWAEAFSKVEIEGDERQKTVFASAYYHSLIKPSDWSGEGVFGIEGDCLLDLMTLWDMNKTQLPLVLTLFPEMGRKLMHSLRNLQERHGVLPHMLVLSDNLGLEAQQARGLAAFVIADAYFRGLCDGETGEKLLEAAYADLTQPDYRDFWENGHCRFASHVIDMAEALRAMAIMAKESGHTALAAAFAAGQDKWRLAYGKDGLLREDSEFYEGSRWNYSFRLLADMPARVALTGQEVFEAQLDRFFGFTQPADTTARFEGFNNETDMETPYAYHYIGRHDRLCEILDAQYRFCYVPGRGGAPGEVDSGGLSSCYVWNCLGLFPVSGQDKMLLGAPAFSRARLALPAGPLEIRREGSGRYTRRVTFNGNPVPSRELTVREMMQGGVLVFEMSERPVTT